MSMGPLTSKAFSGAKAVTWAKGVRAEAGISSTLPLKGAW